MNRRVKMQGESSAESGYAASPIAATSPVCFLHRKGGTLIASDQGNSACGILEVLCGPYPSPHIPLDMDRERGKLAS